MMERARVMRPPKAAPIDWWPRQTPNSGNPRSAQSLTTSTEIPAFTASPGPGEITTPCGSELSSAVAEMASLRTTSTCASNSERYCTRL